MAVRIKKTLSTNALTSEQIATINLVYPVGSYFKTSDSGFDPNKEWAGVWTLTSDGWHRTA